MDYGARIAVLEEQLKEMKTDMEAVKLENAELKKFFERGKGAWWLAVTAGGILTFAAVLWDHISSAWHTHIGGLLK